MYDACLRHRAEGELAALGRRGRDGLGDLPVHGAHGVGGLEVVPGRLGRRAGGRRLRLADETPDAAEVGEELRVCLRSGVAGAGTRFWNGTVDQLG